MLAPVHGADGVVVGVAAMKMRGRAITSIVDVIRNEERSSFLVDGDGVIIHHPNEHWLYHSLMPLSPSLQQQIADEKRFGIPHVDSLALNDLANCIRSVKGKGYAAYPVPSDGVENIAGFSTIGQHDWTVVVSEDKRVFARPLQHLYSKALESAIIVGILSIALGLLFAQIFLRPIRSLCDSANAVAFGNYTTAKVDALAEDELQTLVGIFNCMVNGIQARERERAIFGRMVSPEVREKLLSGQLALGGENRRVSVLFSDIRNFSTLSEQLTPQEVVTMPNEYMTELANAVRPWSGYINNFIGDAIVVVFGAPGSLPNIEWSAVGAALEMRARLEVFNQRRTARGDPLLNTGIGISTGDVVAGQLGSLERFLYTVIGDAVNVAARLEAMTKRYQAIRF